jgi:predicted amidohydrolase YtcJ
MKPADLILQNGRITTLDTRHPEAKEVIIADGRIVGVDNASEFEPQPETKVIDLKGRRVIPGLYDSHLHVIRGGLNYNMELRWGGAFAVARAANDARAGSSHSTAAVGAGGRRMERISVRRAADADAGGGYQNYPEDYAIIQQLHERGEMTLRIAYNLFTQKPGGEFEGFERWSKVVKPDEGDDILRCNGAGEMLVFSAADFEDFLEPRPDLPEKLESELERVVRFLAENPLAISTSRDLRRVDRAISWRFRKGQSGRANSRLALVLRSLRNDFGSQYRAHQGSGRWNCNPAPDGISG